MKFKFRRLGCIALTAMMLSSFSVSTYVSLAQDDIVNGVKVETTQTDTVSLQNVTGKVNIDNVVLENLASNVYETNKLSATVKHEERTVIVTLDEPSLAESSPVDLTVGEYLNTTNGRKALNKIERSQADFLSSLTKSGIAYTLVDSYTTVVNAVAIKVNTSKLSKIKSFSKVVTASVSETYAVPNAIVDAQTNPNNVYTTGIYNSEGYGDGGSGMTVAILDTGLDYTHEAFNVYPSELGMTKSDVESVMSQLNATKLSLAKGDSLEVSDLYLNDKVPFAYDYADDDADVYPAYSQHGVHVAGIVGGQADFYTDKDGKVAVDENGQPIPFIGAAPNCQLVICKVFTDNLESKDIGGATSEDIIAALEDCVTLGVDVINMSLGTSAGFSTVYIEGDEEGELLNTVYTSIRDRGISLICAASNDYSAGYGSNYGTNLTSNPDSATVGSPSTFVGAMSVASINGLQSPYMIANEQSPIFFEESSDNNGVRNDFVAEMLEGATSKTFKYVVIPGTGQPVDYTNTIVKKLQDKEAGEKVIAVVKRGGNTFKEKVELAQKYADAIIVYNNVAGIIRMNLGDLVNPIPAISVSIDAGYALTSKASSSVGYVEINTSYLAGPFMNDYSSWGPTPDLKIKPDITAHGGEITSAVAGGYSEMSGTSMASPNLAGLTAIVRSYLAEKFPSLNAIELKERVNQIVMSTAETVYNETGLPYSPRKQGSGLAVLENIFGSNAYLYTYGENAAEENRPKAELGDGKEGVYDIAFKIENFGTTPLSFKTKSIFFTETVARGGIAVAEKAYMLNGTPSWTVNNASHNAEGIVTVQAGETAEISVRLTLSSAEKKYINDNFANGMFVEGFIKLESETTGQCDLNLPFMGFYGDWESSTMLDYDCFEIAEIEKDTSIEEEKKEQARVWATQPYAMYYNNRYVIPMGNFLYLQDENADQIYTNPDYLAISCYNDFISEESYENYMTSTGIKALYAGLLRNAELVTYEVTNSNTGELIRKDNIYRVNKAYAAGGSSIPAQVLLELTPADLGLVANGKYKIDFNFYLKADYVDDPTKQNPDNAFSMEFYVDYEAPILNDSRIRYYDYKENNKLKQRIYLDIDVYDNHYPQAMLLCYSEYDKSEQLVLKLATEYATPIYNPVKNGTTTVSIEITDFYEKYKDRLYIQVDDYAMNHNIYQIHFDTSKTSVLPDTFEIEGDSELTLGLNESKRLSLSYEGNANISNFNWSVTDPRVLSVKDGEIFAKKTGKTTVTVNNGKGVSRKFTVTVVDKGIKLNLPSISFDVIENSGESLVKAQGVVKVNAGQEIPLKIVTDPWYYPLEKLSFVYSSSDESIATVSADGVVQTLNERGTAIIQAVMYDEDGNNTGYSTSVILNVQDPFLVENMTLMAYHGLGGEVVIPDDKNIIYIGEEAFKDNEDITSIVIPKTVQYIQERAFWNCTNLESVYFISKDKLEIADSDLSIIYRNAFKGCTSLTTVDFSNVKVASLDKYVFQDCTSLSNVIKMEAIGKMDDRAFANCTSLTSANLTGLHTSGSEVFAGCTGLSNVTTSKYTVIGNGMFTGCTGLTEVTLNCSKISDRAFSSCGNLNKVTFGDNTISPTTEFVIGNEAFSSCIKLSEVNFNGFNIVSIGDSAFYNCQSLTELTLPVNDVKLGVGVFKGSPVELKLPTDGAYESKNGAIYVGTTLIKAPAVINSSYAIDSSTTAIASNAFANSVLDGVTSITIPASVTEIARGAFANSTFKSVVLPNLTVIAESLFENSSIESIVIPNTVTKISASAFRNCANLKTVTINSSVIEEVGNFAFANTPIETITFIDGSQTAKFGNYVFMNCENLTTVTLPSITAMGQYNFYNTQLLSSVTFGENSTTVGAFTFANFFGSNVVTSSLKTVVIGSQTTKIGDYAFYGATELEEIDLSGVTEVGESSFMGCLSLASVNGFEGIKVFKTGAFYDCVSLNNIDLSNATHIGDYAFTIEYDDASYAVNTTLDLSSVEEIGSYAFAYGRFNKVILSNSLSKVGSAVFAYNYNLKEIEIEDNANYFVDELGALYRVIALDDKTSYELVAYPNGKTAPYIDQKATVTVLDRTVSIGAGAFSGVKSGAIKKIILPYSVKTIGDMAFYQANIQEYQFESINAPTLLTEFRTTGIEGFNAALSANFQEYVLGYSTDLTSDAKVSTLKLFYPSNGIGYDNYLYKTYFGTATTLGEYIDDNTRTVKENIEGFVDSTEVATWVNKEVTPANKEEVQAFSDLVKETHRLYNNIKSEVQLGFLNEELIQKLTDIERELKAVKSRFGITVKVSKLSIATDSNHKTTYKVGERFSKNGLKLIVEYDDYSTEYADMSKVSVSTQFDRPFDEYDKYVSLTGYGKTVRVPITISATGQTGSSSDGCKSSVSEVTLIISAFTICLGYIILRKRESR